MARAKNSVTTPVATTLTASAVEVTANDVGVKDVASNDVSTKPVENDNVTTVEAKPKKVSTKTIKVTNISGMSLRIRSLSVTLNDGETIEVDADNKTAMTEVKSHNYFGVAKLRIGE